MKHVIKTLHKAASEAADSMTTILRKAAVSSGWDPEVADKLVLDYSDKQYTLKVHPDYKSRVLDHEFGTEGVPPKPILRKFLADPTFFDQHVGKTLHKQNWSGKK
jgi:hypothetical protein